jgi:hypothetical protein
MPDPFMRILHSFEITYFNFRKLFLTAKDAEILRSLTLSPLRLMDF